MKLHTTSTFIALPAPRGCCYCRKAAGFRLRRRTVDHFEISTIITNEKINVSINLVEDDWLPIEPERRGADANRKNDRHIFHPRCS